ncbi:regulatory protein GemA [Rhizobium sp. CC-YZS058]|uniref:gp16 family protein n=1 Tax=Rhizobium sp. CC-YZS058 TaxID=3042153 RepID=UPI002B0581E8|nr:regulatory protein GemA [Rhizobium sp. CC-YZS058]MEA3533705.1 regulatory protein GemA [Rhizobium sp. CC-YZS058]
MSSSIAAIKVAQKQLGLDDDVYRARLHSITGKTSAKDMTEDERQRVIEDFRRLGFRPATRRQDGRQKLTGKYVPKLQALWIAAYNLGIARERDDSALLAFVKRQTGIDHTRFLHDAADARRVIEALKGWMEREAKVDWTVSKFTAEWEKAEGYRIARAQWVILVGPAEAKISRAFWDAIVGILGRHVAGRELTQEEWIPVMNTFGERIRRRKIGG